MSWLLTGGAGYIGAHVADAMRRDGHEVVVLDDLSSGRPERVPGVPLVELGLLDGVDALTDACVTHGVHGVVHLAAKKSVPESVAHPLYYYDHNVTGTVALLRAAGRSGVRAVLYSSSAAVYGETGDAPVTEAHPTAPTNPYGESKLAAEWAVRRTAEATGLAWTALRYFNVAGAARPELVDHGGENLLPRVLRAVARGDAVPVFGTDYPTPDGTCVRDYVDVVDLADAHAAAVTALEAGTSGGALNVGRGQGLSVLEVLDAVGAATGAPVPREEAPRRAGDPARVVADVGRIADVLGWRARRGVAEMVEGALAGASPAQSPR